MAAFYRGVEQLVAHVAHNHEVARFDSCLRNNMKDDKTKNLEQKYADIITGKPHDFGVGDKKYRLYPVTLAKTFELKRYIDALSVDKDILKINAGLEIVRLVREKKSECCSILAIHICPNTYNDLYDTKARLSRHNIFMKMNDEDLASLLQVALSGDNVDAVAAFLNIDKERERLKEVLAKKRKSRNNMDFGGVSTFGNFIGKLKEMGFSVNEILYECGVSFLQLVLADKQVSLYLTDEEVDSIPALVANPDTMDANNPAMTEQILGKLANRGLTVNRE